MNIYRLLSRHTLGAAAAALLVMASGMYMLQAGRAAPPLISTEPERGVVQTPAAVSSDPAASQEQAVRFAAGTPSGQAVPASDLPGWKHVYKEDFLTDVPTGSFPGTSYASTFGAYPDGWKDSMKIGTYMSSKVNSVHSGVLDWHLRYENGVYLVAAPTPKVPVSAKLYGRYAVRFRADPVIGYKTAWLLWPDSDIWNEGEIDFPEGDLEQTISGFSHCAGPTPQDNCLAADTPARFTEWHTAVTEWVPGRVTFYLDGVLIGTTTDRVPNTPMHWVLQTETRLIATPPPTTSAGHVQVDWVAAWARL